MMMEKIKALNGMDLVVKKGEFISIMGPWQGWKILTSKYDRRSRSSR